MEGHASGAARQPQGSGPRAAGRSRGPPVVITERGKDALLRKYSTAEMSDARGVTRARLLSRFVGDLGSKRFGGLVLGYEGAIHDTGGDHAMPLKEIGAELERVLRAGTRIGIVSGLGHEEVGPKLRHTIPSTFWEEVHVGYCNCAEMATLDEHPDAVPELAGGLAHILEGIMSGESEIPSDAVVPRPPYQISVRKDGSGRRGAADVIEAVKKTGPLILRDVKVLESEQYTDIIPRQVSRYGMVGRIRNAIPRDQHVLCIGSRGRWPGADSEMLTHRYSLSTDTVSATAASCWNLLPAGERGEQGALTYIKSIGAHPSGGGFAVSM